MLIPSYLFLYGTSLSIFCMCLSFLCGGKWSWMERKTKSSLESFFQLHDLHGHHHPHSTLPFSQYVLWTCVLFPRKGRHSSAEAALISSIAFKKILLQYALFFPIEISSIFFFLPRQNILPFHCVSCVHNGEKSVQQKKKKNNSTAF